MSFDVSIINDAWKEECEKTVYRADTDFRVKAVILPNNDLAPRTDEWYNEAENYLNVKLPADYKGAKGNEVALIRDIVNNALMDFQGIYERRIAKVVEIAQLNSAGNNIELINMVSYELELYHAIHDALVANRSKFNNRFYKYFTGRLL
jgi:hypothetical protein